VSAGTSKVAYTYGTTIVSQRRGGSTSYYGYDSRGNVSFLTDGAGVVTDTYEYDAWGNLIAKTGSTPNARLYAGEEFDQDIGLLHLRAREYRTDTGRFVTIDPLDQSGIGSPGMLNRYLYATGEPVNLFDPSGRATAAQLGFALTFAAVLAVTPVTIQLGLDGKGTTPLTTGAVFALGAATYCLFLYSADWMADELRSAAGIPGDTALWAPPFQHCNHKRECLPCTPVPVGGEAFQCHSAAAGNEPHDGMADHTHHFKMHQSPPSAGCRCFWDRDFVPPTPGCVPRPGAVPLQPAGGGGIAP
jgi:RHS repeat-associated protein